MTRDEARKLDEMERLIERLQRQVDEFQRSTEKEYEDRFDATVTSAMPAWVRDLLLERVMPIFAEQIRERRRRGIQSTEISVGETVRFIIYHAIRNPHEIEPVTLGELWDIKKGLDEERL
jgi:hypothetical protein